MINSQYRHSKEPRTGADMKGRFGQWWCTDFIDFKIGESDIVGMWIQIK